jgi:hypothetical protein
MKINILIIPFVMLIVLLAGCEYVEKIGLEIKETTSSSCKQKASKLVPDFLVISSNGDNQIGNSFKDGTPISIERATSFDSRSRAIRKGSAEGENVNYYYLEKGKISYSKQIIDDSGLILGTRRFEIAPVLDLADINLELEVTSGEKGFSAISWDGFTEQVKKILGTNSISFKMTLISFTTDDSTLIDDSFNEEKGNIHFLGRQFSDWCAGSSYCGTGRENIRLKISPDILSNKIYKIVDYEITNCEWVGDEPDKND